MATERETPMTAFSRSVEKMRSGQQPEGANLVLAELRAVHETTART